VLTSPPLHIPFGLCCSLKSNTQTLIFEWSLPCNVADRITLTSAQQPKLDPRHFAVAAEPLDFDAGKGHVYNVLRPAAVTATQEGVNPSGGLYEIVIVAETSDQLAIIAITKLVSSTSDVRSSTDGGGSSGSHGGGGGTGSGGCGSADAAGCLDRGALASRIPLQGGQPVAKDMLLAWAHIAGSLYTIQVRSSATVLFDSPLGILPCLATPCATRFDQLEEYCPIAWH
jgi:hypothetical protein